MNFLEFKEASFMKIFACIIDDILEKERIGSNVTTILFLFISKEDIFIEGIANSTSPCKKREVVEVNKFLKIKQGIEKNTIIPKMF